LGSSHDHLLNRPASPDEGGGPVRVRIDVAYDGTEFSGWATQPDQRTVQATIEAALTKVLNLDAPARLTCAGRTDAGVHARGQVTHVDLPPGVITDSLEARLRAVLPSDVTVVALSMAPPGFDARFSALSRRYTYTVCDKPRILDPLRRRDVLAFGKPLGVDAMNAAGTHLIGEHDFAAFCRRRPGATTVRQILELDWQRTKEPPEYAVLTIRADAFCHSMVRSLVGAMLAVGDGRRTSSWLVEYLDAAQRASDVQVAPPWGLVLEHVQYPADEDLAARAVVTRARRG
jgi:tRNA pseudouridine38-40 synthase